MQKLLTLLIFLLGFSSWCAAQRFIIPGRVTDQVTGEALPYASVRVQGEVIGTLANEKGDFSMEIPRLGVVLEVSQLGYRKHYVRVDKIPKMPLKIELKQKDIELERVVISDGLQRVFKDKKLYLYDYEFWEDQLFVIYYDREERSSKIALVDENDSIVAVHPGPEVPGKLVKDCLGNVHALTPNLACQLFTIDGEIEMYIDSLELFNRYVKPCLAQVEDNYFYKFYRFNSQILLYYTYNATAKQGEYFVELKDKDRIHQLLDPHPSNIYRGIAQSEEEFLSIPNSTWKEVATINDEFQFYQHAFFKPIYAPLRVIDQQIHVFDHLNGELRRYESDGEFLRSTAIHYQEEPHWKEFVIVDEVRGDAYTAFENHETFTLAEIDQENGEILGRYELPREFPTKVTVRDGVVFFMYRELNYDDTNRLYRLRIKD